MKIFINPLNGEETIVTDPNLYSIYERYEYIEKVEEKKDIKPPKKNSKK